MTPQDMRQIFPDTMLEVGVKDKNLVILVGDIGHFALQPFAQSCPGRYFNVGILEPTIVSMAAGISSIGLHPVVHTIAPFLIERSFEQIKLDFCYQNLGGNLVSAGSAFEYSTLGCTHHTYSDIALINSLPNTEIIYPASPVELNTLFKQTYSSDKLTYMRMTRQPHGVIFNEDQVIFGKGILVREGSDVTLVATGPQLRTAIESVPILESIGLSAEILYYPTLKPFDKELVVSSASKTKKIVTIEEHAKYGGLGDYVLHAVFGIEGIKFDAIHLPEKFLRSYGTYEEHCKGLGFTAENLVNKVNNICGVPF